MRSQSVNQSIHALASTDKSVPPVSQSVHPCARVDGRSDLEVGRVGEAGAPRVRHADKHAVGGVELAVLLRGWWGGGGDK